MSKRMQRAVSGAPRSCGRACGRHGGAAAATPPSPHATDPLSSYPPSLASPTSACSCAGPAPVAARHLSAHSAHARAPARSPGRGGRKNGASVPSVRDEIRTRNLPCGSYGCMRRVCTSSHASAVRPEALPAQGWGGVGVGMGKAKRRGATSRGRRAQQARAGRRAVVGSGPFSPCTPALAPREGAARRARAAVARPLAIRAAKDGRRQR